MTESEDLLNTMGEPIPGKTYLADGWVYRDLPRMTEPYFSQLIDLLGEDNIVWLTRAKYHQPDGSFTQRGQMLVSPTGMDRLRAHIAEQEA